MFALHASKFPNVPLIPKKETSILVFARLPRFAVSIRAQLWLESASMSGQADHHQRAKRFHPIGRSLELKKVEIEQTIPDRFEQIVRLHSNRLALKAGKRSLTYDELNRFANRIARTIMATRGRSREPIALLFANVIDVIGAIFGVLKAGKFFLTIDPSWPANKIKFILDDAQARMIITNNLGVSLVQRLKIESHSILNIDEISEDVCAENLGLRQSPEQFASILYTSGSTGEPKGIIDNHLVNMHLALLDDTRFEDRASLLHSVAFGSGRSDVFFALLNGAALFAFDLKTEGLHRLPRWLNEEQITICHLPPLAFRRLAEHYSALEEPHHLRKLRLSGAPVTRVEFDLYKKIFPASTSLQINMGSAETRRICGAIIDHNFQFSEEGVPVGYLAPWKKLLLLDDNGHEVGPGETGEIAVKSRYLSIGYWRKPDLTSAKFLRDFEGDDERTYLTGDLGRLLSDGFLIHLGRKDLMVKIRGYRVELGEIERSLLAHPQVKDAGVAAWNRELEDTYLAAYIVPRESSGPTVDALCSFLREKLPDYMIPSAFLFVESLPLNNGKLDRKALPKPDDKRPALKQAYAPARNEIEKELVRIWETVLNIVPVGIHDNFFHLGGHSLSAMRIVSRVIAQFQLDVHLQLLFQSPTVAEMAIVITEYHAKTLGAEDLASILDQLESLSGEEAQRLVGETTLPHAKQRS
jgi:amino acid adenylation domain-containing protein